LCGPIQVKHYAPLWGKEPLAALEEMLQAGFHMLVIEVDTALGSNREWLGKEIDAKMISELKALKSKQEINPIGEWGEYHTIVLDGPIYKKRINVLKMEIKWEKTKGYVTIKKADLQPKA
jgi:diphthine-ammonia ligase